MDVAELLFIGVKFIYLKSICLRSLGLSLKDLGGLPQITH